MKQLRPYQQQAVNECWQALRKDDQPVLLMASVGAGKSLMLSDILLTMQKAGKRALCLVNNAELVRNNCASFIEQGGHGSIWCAALKSKDCSAPVVFGTPKSVLNGIDKAKKIASVKFNIIVVDEAHNIDYNNHRSYFMRILRYYKHQYIDMRVLGATGTDFRFKGADIVGKDCLFKSRVGNITTEKLIEDGYLIRPEFEIDPNLVIDFSKVKIKSNGQFDQKQIAKVIEENARLTELICKQVIHIMESEQRFGVFLFASTRKHAHEIMSHLPPEQSALILGDTPQHERETILNKARRGEIRYLCNISIISVGVDVPAYDTLAYLRPTESLVLMVQTMGRVLRLSPNTNKSEARVLDFAGNIERHQNWDNPILLEALSQTIDKDKPLDIQCPACMEWNSQTVRRCIGTSSTGRCEYFFEFKECHECSVQNDIASRQCRSCDAELIDPNAKLSLAAVQNNLIELKVIEARFGISGTSKSFSIHAAFICKDDNDRTIPIHEKYTPVSDKAKRYFYAVFIKKHLDTPSDWYPLIHNRDKMQTMLNEVNAPTRLLVTENENGFKIKVRYFDE